MSVLPRLNRVAIGGYRPFRDFSAQLGPLEVLVGANGAGKTSLFEFLRLLRDAMTDDIPPEIVPGPPGRAVFHSPGPEWMRWELEAHLDEPLRVRYDGVVSGPVGRPCTSAERAIEDAYGADGMHLDMAAGRGQLRPAEDSEPPLRVIELPGPGTLALSTLTDTSAGSLHRMREFIRSWRFYSSADVSTTKLTRPFLLEQQPMLREDCGNLSAVLHLLMTEHPDAFERLQVHLRTLVPGFRSLTVKARGGPGEVMAFWRERGPDDALSLADLSSGSLHLLCWAALCLHPTPPPLVCVDEPDQSVHPRALPILASLFQEAATRTQIILATHSSYFLAQFRLEEIAVLRKENGDAVFRKPADSEALRAMLEDFGPAEIEALHRSDELEVLA